MKGNKQLAAFFLLFSFGITSISAALPDRGFSQRENRFLAAFPAYGLRRVISGEFMTDFEQYIDDQFPVRDAWVLLKADLERLLGKRENNGIYFGADGYLLPRYQADAAWLVRNTSYVNEFARRIGLPVSLLLAPTASAIYPEKLPRHAPTDDQQAAWREVLTALDREITTADLLAALGEQRDEEIYFRTDHHWTMRGAYYAYAAWMRSKGEEPLPLSAFQSELISDSFWGTHYSKANLRQLTPDRIELLNPVQSVPVTVEYPGEGMARDSLFAPEYLAGRDQYAYFLGGNYPLVQVKTGIGNGKRILLIKDSYAHVLVSFLAAHYQEIHLIDLRYYASSVQSYAADQQLDEVLFLFNLQQFSANTGLAKLGS